MRTDPEGVLVLAGWLKLTEGESGFCSHTILVDDRDFGDELAKFLGVAFMEDGRGRLLRTGRLAEVRITVEIL